MFTRHRRHRIQKKIQQKCSKHNLQVTPCYFDKYIISKIYHVLFQSTVYSIVQIYSQETECESDMIKRVGILVNCGGIHISWMRISTQNWRRFHFQSVWIYYSKTWVVINNLNQNFNILNNKCCYKQNEDDYMWLYGWLGWRCIVML